MCFENHHLAYKCRKLRNLGKSHSTWFYYNAINIKATENGRINKLFHAIEKGKLLNIDNLGEFLNRWIFFTIYIYILSIFIYIYIIYIYIYIYIYVYIYIYIYIDIYRYIYIYIYILSTCNMNFMYNNKWEK